MGLIETLPYVQCAYYGIRTVNIRRVCVHTPESPERWNGADSLAQYLADPNRNRRKGGYHFVTDGNSAVRTANLGHVVAGAGGDNEHTVHICLIGYAGQSAVEWTDPFSVGAIDQAARIAAELLPRYKIPARRLSVPEIRANGFGLEGHVDVGDAFGKTDHWDPGPHFPWNLFITGIKRHMYPPVKGEYTLKLTDTVDALSTNEGAWRLTGDGGVFTVRGPFYGSCGTADGRLLERIRKLGGDAGSVDNPFVAITGRAGARGYAIWTASGHVILFGPDHLENQGN